MRRVVFALVLLSLVGRWRSGIDVDKVAKGQ